jgi:hypothetical protein
MKYIVKSDEGHTAELVPTSRKNKGGVRSVSIDLSQASLFSAPDPKDVHRRIPQLLHPLKHRSEVAFHQLDRIPLEQRQRSPLIAALLHFRESRLPELLANLERPFPDNHSSLRKLEDVSKDPSSERQLLQKIVSTIDRQLPNYFRPEKEIGTFVQLASGLSSPPTVKVAAEGLPGSTVSNCTIQDHAGKHTLFDCQNRVALSPTNLPTGASVLRALCAGGTLGEELLGLNQATLVELSTRALYPPSDPRLDREFLKRIRTGIWRNESLFRIRTHYRIAAGMAVLSGINVLARGVPAISGLMQGSSAPQVLVHVGISAISAVATFCCIRSMKNITGWVNTTAQDIFANLKEFDRGPAFPKGTASLRTLPSALISHLVAISGGRQRTLFGAGNEQSWKGELPKLKRPDESALKHCPTDMTPEGVMPTLTYTVTAVDDFKASGLSEKEIQRLGSKSLFYANFVERSAHAWNVAHAIEVLRNFCETQGVSYANTPWLDTVKMFNRKHQFETTNEAGVFPDMQRAFAQVTHHLGINSELWETIALPLQAAYTLERLEQTRQAQQIACAIVEREVTS